MANNQQAAGGNSMAAMLGNMQRPNPGQPQPVAYGGGMQPSTMGGGMAHGNVYNMPGQTPYQFGGGGSPQQPMGGPGLGGPVQAAPGAPAGMADVASMLGAAGAGPQKPMPSFGGPAGGGAPAKGGGNPQIKQAIAGLQGGPPMGQRPGMRPRPQNPNYQMPPGAGMNPALRR